MKFVLRVPSYEGVPGRTDVKLTNGNERLMRPTMELVRFDGMRM